MVACLITRTPKGVDPLPIADDATAMLAKTPLQQLIPQRLTQLKKRMEKALWSPAPGTVGIRAAAPSEHHTDYRNATAQPLTQLSAFPHTWGPKWAQAWFQLDVPAEAFAAGLWLEWQDDAESTLYADGVPWYGFDPAHTRAPLPKEAQALWVEGICCRTGVWVPGASPLPDEGSILRGARLWQRNEAAWDGYFDYVVLLDLLEFEYKRYMPQGSDWASDWDRGNGYHKPIFRISARFRKVLRQLDAFADAYDHEGLAAAPMLKEVYKMLPTGGEALRAILTGHAHIDLVWLWPERVGDAKAVHTFAIANRLMEQYPELRFGYSQPASYDAVARRSPELIREVKQRIASGQWEATGAADVESDTQLPCGEALARSFVIGQERFRELRGSPSRVLWLPDVFGYSPCMPQILKQTGVSWFFTTKLTWGTITRFPYSSFRWRGHDGSEVVVHVSQEVGYNGATYLYEFNQMEECQQEAGIHDEFLVPTGFGDGGGGVTPEILERARRLQDLSGMPRCEWGRIEQFFERLDALKDSLPEWQGELYLEYHRGVQTTHGDFKAAFRASERALQLWEAAHACTAAGPIDQHPWRRVVFCQFHDAIPGSSIREVYEELIPELNGICQRASNAARDAFGAAPLRHLWNPLPLPRRVVHEAHLYDLPPLGCVALADGQAPQAAIKASPSAIDNGRVHAQFNAYGEVQSLRIDGHPIALTAPANQLWIYPDHPHAFPAWDIDRPTLGNGIRVTSDATATVECAAADRAVVAFSRQLTAASSVVVRYILEAESAVLRVEWEVDWQDRNLLLKSVSPTSYNGRMARFGAPFGSTLRPQQSGEPSTEAMYEVPASRWALVADDGESEGLAMITEAKYGFSVRAGTVGLSLLRSAEMPGKDEHTAIRTLANPDTHSDIGHWNIRAAFAAWQHDCPREQMPAALADTLFQPAVPVAAATAARPLLQSMQGGNSLLPVWVQPLDDGAVVIRCNETMGRRGTCTVSIADGYQLSVVDLQGNPYTGVRLDQNTLEFGPYALFGLKLTPA
jgi:alpha-mannosidase